LLQENLEQQKFENAELISYIQALEKDLSCLTSSTVAKDREITRKDLEKAKTKLKETESKLKIAIQEKTKIEVFFFGTSHDSLVSLLAIYFSNLCPNILGVP